MAGYYSPEGNLEEWDEKPEGYYTPEEWFAAHPIVEPTPSVEEQYYLERATVEDKYTDPRNGGAGGILTAIKDMFLSAVVEGKDTASLQQQYLVEIQAMQAEFAAIDEKYGVN